MDYPTQYYQGWDPAAAQQDWQAKGKNINLLQEMRGGGSSGGGGVSSVDDILNNAIGSIMKLVPKAVKPYEEVNPFFFDEALAKQAATAQYAPYYNEMLSDYISEVERKKSRSVEDLRIVTEQLEAGKEYYMGTERRLLDKALRGVNEGYAGRGLFLSGAREKDLRELKEESEYKTGEYLRQYGEAKSSAQLAKERGFEDIDTAKSMYERDIEREKQYAITSGVLQRKSETREEYEAGRRKYYDNALYGNLT